MGIPLMAKMEDGKVVGLDEWPDAAVIQAKLDKIMADMVIIMDKMNRMDAGYSDAQNRITGLDNRLKHLESKVGPG
jgi:archaellum component FlaC